MANTKPSSLHSDSFLAVTLLVLKGDMSNFSALLLRGLPLISFLSDCLHSPIGRQQNFLLRSFQTWCFDSDVD